MLDAWKPSSPPPGQGRRARQGHAELRRQPRRRLLHAGGDAPHRAPRPGLRRGGCADRPAIGRPKSATYRTADVVGLDTLAHVIGTMQATLPDDPWHAALRTPGWLTALIAKGALGQKTRAGIYRKEGKAINVLDLAKQDYRLEPARSMPRCRHPEDQEPGGEVRPAARASVTRRRSSSGPSSATSSTTAPSTSRSIADNARDVDFAMRWGFGWAQGPFETWQAAGWQAIAECREGRHRGRQGDERRAAAGLGVRCATGRACAERLVERAPKGPQAALDAAGVCAPALPRARARRAAEERGTTLWENAGVRLWTCRAGRRAHRHRAVLQEMHALGPDVLDGMLEAVARAERDSTAW
jgi:3-hydroxyacyl-CoA dehydrogenase